MKKTIAICLITYLLFSVLLPSAALYAQWYNPDNVNKKAAAFYANAYNDAQDCNYTQAKENVNKALAVDAKFVDAYLTRAGIFCQ